MLLEVDNQKLWKGDRQSQRRHSLHLGAEWLACTLFIVVLAIWTDTSGVLCRLDNALYDRLIKLDAKPARQDIVIVAIDASSLTALGPWPWNREMHAKLLYQLSKSRPRAVALDVLFQEPSQNQVSDEIFSQALKLPGLGEIFLPVALAPPARPGQPNLWQAPIPILSRSASGLGHINIELDTDGIVRSMHLHDVLDNKVWPSLSWLLYRASLPKSEVNHSAKPMSVDANVEKIMLPYSGPSGHYRTIPYVNVLRGEVPDSIFENKLVLIGVTALGIGDQFVTPVSGEKIFMPGVEIVATALEGLLDDRIIKPLSPTISLVINLALLLGWMLLLFHFGPRSSILALVFIVTISLLISSELLFRARIWWPVATFLICALTAYIIWSWRRVSVMFADLKYRSKSLKMVSRASLTNETVLSQKEANDWNGIITALDEGIQVAELSRLEIMETLQAMPEAVLLVNAKGVIRMANAKAKSLLGNSKLSDSFALQWIQSSHASSANGDHEWHDLMEKIISTRGNGLKLQLPRGDFVLLRITAIRNLENINSPATADPWCIVTLVDVTEQNRLQRQRDEALQLLWHDIRAPQAAILTLLQKTDTDDIPNTQSLNRQHLKERIKLQVDTTLALADDFVWQLRADSGQYDFQEVDIILLAHEIVERAWPLASVKNIHLECEVDHLLDFDQRKFTKAAGDTVGDTFTPPLEYGLWLHVEPRLLGRALFNLLDNAIKYSPANTKVTLGIQISPRKNLVQVTGKEEHPCSVHLTVTDHGFGISSENLPHIFEPYTRFSSLGPQTNQGAQAGHGLGLRMVKTVIEAHRGQVHCSSTLGKGTVFTIELPLE